MSRSGKGRASLAAAVAALTLAGGAGTTASNGVAAAHGFAGPAATSKATSGTVGLQRALVVLIKHVNECRVATQPCPADRANLGGPRTNAAAWESLLNSEVDGFFNRASYGAMNWRFRVIANPNSQDGWWTAPHTVQEYANNGSNFQGEAAIVRDAVEVIVPQAVAAGAIGLIEALGYDRVLVIDNFQRRGGQSWPGVAEFRPTFRTSTNISRLPWRTAAAVAAEGPSDSTALTVIRHELAHELGLPDLYSTPCPGDGNRDGVVSRDELGPCRCPLVEPGGVADPALGGDPDCVGGWDLLAFDWRGGTFGALSRILAGWLPLGSPLVRRLPLDFRGTVELSPLTLPRPGRPVVLRIPPFSGAEFFASELAENLLASAIGGRMRVPFTGFQVECRYLVRDDVIPREGVLVSWVDETRGSDHPQHVVRTSASQSIDGAILAPGELYVNRTLGVRIANAGQADDGTCSVELNIEHRASIGYGALVPPGGVRTLVPRFTTGRDESLALFSAGGVALGLRAREPEPPRPGRSSMLRFGYANLGTAAGTGGVAQLFVSEPYAAPSACGGDAPGRRAGTVSLQRLAPGKLGQGRVFWRPRLAGSVGLTVRLGARGDGFTGDDRITSSFAFQTHRLRTGRQPKPQYSEIVVSASRSCPGPVVFEITPFMLPRGWRVDVEGAAAPLRPGEKRRVRLAVTAPPGARPGTVVIPIVVSAADEPRHGFSGGYPLNPSFDPGPLGGLDVIARVVRGGAVAAPFRIPLAAVRLRVPTMPAPVFPTLPPCSDGTDNDADGKIDGSDAGCESRDDTSESPDQPAPPPPPIPPQPPIPPPPPPPPVTQCSDGKDNDSDGNVDFPNDKECKDASDDDEAT